MPDERLIIFTEPNEHVNKITWINEIYIAYTWHFRIKQRPATFEEISRFAKWQGLRIKKPTKKDLVNFFLDNKIIF